MKIERLSCIRLVVGAVMLGVAGAFAYPPPPPPPPPPGRVMLPPGTVVCPRCEGFRRVPSGFLGWKEKRCPECKGTGVVVLRGHHHRQPPPPPPKHHRPKKHHSHRH
ncbi:MAG: hypothetical protein ACI4RA_00220 [Kiritimatiellia bacterium]